MPRLRNSQAQKEEPPPGLGRYQQVRGADLPAVGYVGRPVPSQNVRTAIAAVPDPEDPKHRILATVNRAVDLLEEERSKGRIKEDAYRVGRLIQAIGEAAPGIRGSNWSGGDRVDVTRAHNEAVMAGLYHARRLAELEQHMLRRIGEENAKMLRAILVDGLTFRDWAKRMGRRGPRGEAFAAGNFRAQLEYVAKGWDVGELRKERIA
jgi:hypothetical protein